MKILHTSDWHLGRSLYGRNRYDEFTAFLDWLAEVITKQGIDALLVAGDIFDTSAPSNSAQGLYYRFLYKVSTSNCRHSVVVAGNHDSPSFLNAPKELLKALNVHIISSITDNPADEVIVLNDQNNKAEAIVCAVPYLRDRDIRTVEAGETTDDKNTKLIAGIQKHYAEVCQIAEKQQQEYGDIPIVGMGHLFAAGGKTIEGDGVRELYIGSLTHVDKDIFPTCIDYVALGHLHVPQVVGAAEHIRYSGSPIPMGYGEATQNKKVIVVEFNGKTPQINELDIPCFQPLKRISGSLDKITEKIHELKSQTSNAWLEIEYNGAEIAGNLQEQIDETIVDTEMEIRRIKNKRVFDRIISQTHEDETLDDLDVNDVFNRCLDTYEVISSERPALIQSYNEIITSLNENDSNAE